MRSRLVRSLAIAALVAAMGCAPAPEGLDGAMEGVQTGVVSAALEHVPAASVHDPLIVEDARRLAAEERFAEARELLELRLEADPFDEKAALLLGAVDLLDERYRDAYDLAQLFLEDAPTDVRFLQTRARASMLMSDMETARVDFQELLDALYADEGPEQAACGVVTACAAGQAAELAYARIGMATALYNLGALDDAEALASEVFDEACAARNLDPSPAMFVLALVHAKRGDDATAQRLYESILDMHPDAPGALNNLAGVYYRAGDLDTTRDLLVRAFEAAEGDRRSAATAWSNVGEVDLLQGDLDGAEDKLLEATAMSESFSGSHFNLAILYDIRGDSEASAAELERGLALDAFGVDRYNSSYFSTEWADHFEALLAEHRGDPAARELWERVLDGSVELLHATARRHLAASAF